MYLFFPRIRPSSNSRVLQVSTKGYGRTVSFKWSAVDAAGPLCNSATRCPLLLALGLAAESQAAIDSLTVPSSPTKTLHFGPSLSFLLHAASRSFNSLRNRIPPRFPSVVHGHCVPDWLLFDVFRPPTRRSDCTPRGGSGENAQYSWH